MEKKIIYEVTTALAELKVYEDHCTLSNKKNILTLFVTNKFFAGEKKFYYSDLTSVQFRKPGALTGGYLEFEYPGSRSGNNSDAYMSENAISFGDGELEKMEQIYNYIDGRIREIKTHGDSGTLAVSSADELKKFKELLDVGIITQTEFDEKKKQLIGI